MTSLPLAACPPLVLTFAHSDPTSGGGIQADVLTLASLGTHPLTVTTAITVQDTAGLTNTLVLDAECVEDQARALLEDVQVAAFKIGFLGGVEMVSIVAEIVSDYDNVPLVLYPSLTRLLRDESVEDEVFEAMRDLLLPQTTLLVVDIGDVTRLLGELDDDGEDMAEPSPEGAAGDSSPAATAAALAGRILETGCAAVLLTAVDSAAAGAESGGRSNLLFADGGLRLTQGWGALPVNYHGAGETLAAALAACIAGGDEALAAVRRAHTYTEKTLAAGFRPGMGRLMPDRFYWARPVDPRAGAEPNGDHAA